MTLTQKLLLLGIGVFLGYCLCLWQWALSCIRDDAEPFSGDYPNEPPLEAEDAWV